ncbi:hypothetical protein K493DRAFT_276884 [Basidiobolus meristosporus CBS 931.73]|uniref:SPX-domain-containing protein n=1 Tax=Basidiobolus meristosporus CBS 931.73 TaxID=1314790 RepID=A0A1Y1YXX7_9FUNG|nr:hypothetical protein K493DRAFT_276884 [Basidiobolus meristosporus CBS 931.73]|eukprot:ORY02880.1 hypothetical protein K493DRAFT_276884 [Basidiobolus meristosporus CBS 931.73]
MKFGKSLSASAQELPEDWRQHVVHYSKLKKCINRIVQELEESGLANLAAEKNIENTQPVKLVYSFTGTVENFSPNIEVIVGEDAETITPELEAISLKFNSFTSANSADPNEDLVPSHTYGSQVIEEVKLDEEVTSTASDSESPRSSFDSQDVEESISSFNKPTLLTDSSHTSRAVSIVLPTDSEFFGSLSSSINDLTQFEQDMNDLCSTKIVKLGSIISHIGSPHSKDMYTWREIFNLYLNASIWMVGDHVWQKSQSIEKTKKQIQWFIQEITRLSLNRKFRTRDSIKALEEFILLNRDLLAIMQFHELNQTAVRKIIKKHDKRTHLSAQSWFVDLMAPSMLFKGNLSKALLSTLHTELLIIIPQPDDYQCPICLSLSWKPIRLKCGHVFCVQCMINAQRRRMTNCPLCRTPDSITEANTENLDIPRMNFMKLFFPREIKAKQKEHDYEQAREDIKVIGIDEVDSSCVLM